MFQLIKQRKISDRIYLVLKVLFGVIIFCPIILFGFLIFFDFYEQHSSETEPIYLDDNLIFAQTLCRHGDRNTIAESYPNDPWQGLEYWPEGYGQLTKIGKKQHYELGKYFKKRYGQLLGNNEYSADKVYAFSSDVDRTLMSAQVTLAALFPPSTNEIWNEHLKWLPIPVHTEPTHLDYHLRMLRKCHHFDYVMIQYQKTAAYKGLFEIYRPLIAYLEANSGSNLTRLCEILALYDTLHIQKLNGRLPSWAEEVMIPGGEFERLTLYAYEQWTALLEMKKLRSGFLLKDILNRFSNKTQSILTPDRSLWMYFAHDFTIFSLLDSLGMFTSKLVPTASCLLFELYQSDNNNPHVQIFYKNSTQVNIPAMEIPGCGTKCPLSKMYELFDDILPKNSFEVECELRDGESLPPEGNPEYFNTPVATSK